MCDSTRDSVLAKETEPTYLFPTPHYFKKLRHATVAGWWVWHLQGRQAGLRPRGVGGAVSSLKAVLRQNSLFLFRRNINLFFFPKLEAFSWLNEAHLLILFFFFFKLFIWLCQILVVALRFLSSYGRNSPTARGILVHWPRLEPASPELEGRFVTTGPLGKSPPAHLMSQIQDAKWYTTKMSIPLTPDLTPPQALPQTKQWLPIVDFLVGIFYSPVSKGVQIILKWYANDNILLFF